MIRSVSLGYLTCTNSLTCVGQMSARFSDAQKDTTKDDIDTGMAIIEIDNCKTHQFEFDDTNFAKYKMLLD